jgi:MoaA/NifB/PqqE/SkfB family radical SAM enzyme
VSLDHWKKEKHDWLRGRKGSFARVVNGIKLLKKYQIKTRIDTLVWKENYMHLEKMVDFCKKLGVEEIIFAWPVKIGKAAKNYSYIFPPSKEYLKIGEKLERIQRNETKIKILFHRFKYFNASCKNCFGGKKIFYVDPSGRLGPCFWISTILNFFTEKTVFSEKFSNLMKDDVIMNFRKMTKKRYLQFGPGCPFICLIENGNLYSKDPLFINCYK